MYLFLINIIKEGIDLYFDLKKKSLTTSSQLNAENLPTVHWSHKTVNNTGSCFGFRSLCRFRVQVVCNVSLFCVMHRSITQHVRGRGWAHYGKSGALQKKGDALQKT